MEQNTVTVEEVVRATIEILNDIRVPVGLVNEVGIPVARAVQNLNRCIEAWEREEAEQARKRAEGQENADEEEG